jgi:general secretion pathway protein E
MDARSAFDLKAALQTARQLHRSGAGSVLDALLRSSRLDGEDLRTRVRTEAGVLVILDRDQAAPDFALLSQTDARALGCLPLRLPGETTTRLGMADPWDAERVRKATRAIGHIPHLAAVSSALLDKHLGAGAGGPVRRDGGAGSSRGVEASGPIVEFVDTAIRAAFAQGASDVHFECSRAGVAVKLRLDGVMTPYARMDDIRHAEEVISRIKVLAQLDITERRTPQDGRFRFDTGAGDIDLRVSIMPSVFGEDAVLRLLDKAQLRNRNTGITLDVLGFTPDAAQQIRELSGLPHGMLLITGPTGSGKTTTVYAALSEINTGLEKIITIEDPVEYELQGVLQIPVNERKGLTFAKGLRSILRHDPDRILVGEIRDAETAEIAVQSALTGHQVFTTVHANSVFDVVGRFRHFGIDMFGFMSSLNGAIVQRLLRRLCSDCSGVRDTSGDEREWFAAHGHAQSIGSTARAVGCPACHGSGFRGRMVLAEVHAVDDSFRDLAIANAPMSALRDWVRGRGTVGLHEQAARVVKQGQTTLEEVRRVVGWR